MTMLIGLMASSIVFSSFVIPKEQTKKDCSQLVVSVPELIVVYEGVAWRSNFCDESSCALHIKVCCFEYRRDRMWAFVRESYDPDYWADVKENPNYNPNSEDVRHMKYYITFEDANYEEANYYFNM